MNNSVIRAIFMGFVLFVGLSVPKFISEDPLTYRSFIPALAGGLVGGLVIYVGQFFLKNANKYKT